MKIQELTVTELLNLMGYAQAQLKQLPASVVTNENSKERNRYVKLFSACKDELDSRIDKAIITV